VYARSGEWERARLLGRESVQRAREVGDDVLLAQSLTNYAGTINGPAMEIFAEAIACCERAGDASDYYILHDSAGCHALWCGDVPAARAHLETAIRAAEVNGLPPTYAQVNLGLVLRAEHDLDGARRAYEEGLRLCRRLGYKIPMAAAILGLACVAADRGDWHRAATLHGAAQALLDQTGNQWERTECVQRKESLDQIAAAIGDEQLKQAHTQGAALSIAHAIDLALGKSSPP
jgi:tetratricopeptide (TPR) repeat protein